MVLPLIIALIWAASAVGTAKYLLSDDGIPSEPTYHEITEKTTLLQHYPGGRVSVYDPSSYEGYQEYLRLSAANKREHDQRMNALWDGYDWSNKKAAKAEVASSCDVERELQKKYAEAIAKNAPDFQYNSDLFWARMEIQDRKQRLRV
jgi:hypothetical protein